MRTVDFHEILFEALQLAGQDRDNLNTQVGTFRQFRDFANSRMRYAWDAFEWPQVIRYYNLTIIDTGIKEAQLPADAAEVIAVYTKNPLATTNAQQVQFKIYDIGTERRLVFLRDPGEAWVEYKIDNPYIFGEQYLNNIAYKAGSQVYFDEGGETGSLSISQGKPYKGNFYNCINDTTAGMKPTSPGASTYWKKVEIPYFMASYIPRALHADWLRSEMQFELAEAAEQYAEYALTEEIGKITKVQGQAGRINIINNY